MTFQTARRSPIRADAPERRDFTYRQLRIVAGLHGSGFRAIAYRGSKKFLEADAPDIDGAIAGLKDRIEGLRAERLSRRLDAEPVTGELA